MNEDGVYHAKVRCPEGLISSPRAISSALVRVGYRDERGYDRIGKSRA
jgi:hypothetical protein